MKKKYFIVVLIVCIFASPLAAQSYDEISEEITEAFALTFQAYFLSAMMSAFGQTPPGCTITDDTMIFENMDIVAMGLEGLGTYTTLDGLIEMQELEDGSMDMQADLTLTGGPIGKLLWEVKNFAPGNTEGFFAITADEKHYKFSFSDIP